MPQTDAWRCSLRLEGGGEEASLLGYLSLVGWFGDRSRGSFSDLVLHVFSLPYMPGVFCISLSPLHMSDPSQHSLI